MLGDPSGAAFAFLTLPERDLFELWDPERLRRFAAPCETEISTLREAAEAARREAGSTRHELEQCATRLHAADTQHAAAERLVAPPAGPGELRHRLVDRPGGDHPGVPPVKHRP